MSDVNRVREHELMSLLHMHRSDAGVHYVMDYIAELQKRVQRSYRICKPDELLRLQGEDDAYERILKAILTPPQS